MRSVAKSLAAHGVTPGFTLVKVNNEPFSETFQHHDPAVPNLNVGRKLSALQVPFTLHFRRHAPLPTCTHNTWRVFFDGGARRKDDLAGVGFVILKSTKEHPFQSLLAERPSTWDGDVVYESFNRIPVAFRNDTDNMEAEYTAAIGALYEVMLRTHNEIDLYGDCKEVFDAISRRAEPKRAFLGPSQHAYCN